MASSSASPSPRLSPRASTSSTHTVHRQRASRACRRCPPCVSCSTIGQSDQCTFIPRGQSAADRSFRRRFPRGLGGASAAPNAPGITIQSSSAHSSSIPMSSENLTNPYPEVGLPPPDEVVEAIRNYVSSYFQLGFLHKALFVERYMSHVESVSPFLLLSICSIAAPFTPSLVRRYGGKKAATDFFLQKAEVLVGGEMLRPSLERAQAFLLLGVTEWGQGHGEKSWMLIGTAVRMAGFLGLHRESTYQLPPDPAPEVIIESEVARRTFWAIACHENLLAGQLRPMQISLKEIDVLLPCEENMFNFGIQPPSRSSISSTLGEQPYGTVDTPKSLFASLVQVKILWSFTARHACRRSGKFENTPWSTSSQAILNALQDFEVSLPAMHRFSMTNLRGMIVEGLDLAYLSITLITRLSNIVIRRLYLPSMAVAIDPDGPEEMDLEVRVFWLRMASDMVLNSEELLSQVEIFFGMRSPDLGFPPIMVFGVFMCGNVFSYLYKWPDLCPTHAEHADTSYHRCVEILEQLADSWPLASQWHHALKHRRERTVNDARPRMAVRQTQTLDDELAGIYGQSAMVVTPPAESAGGQASASQGVGESEGGPVRDIAQSPIDTCRPYHTHNAQEPSSITFGFDGTCDEDDQIGFLLDSFGDELSAFLQGGAP